MVWHAIYLCIYGRIDTTKDIAAHIEKVHAVLSRKIVVFILDHGKQFRELIFDLRWDGVVWNSFLVCWKESNRRL